MGQENTLASYQKYKIPTLHILVEISVGVLKSVLFSKHKRYG